MAARAKGERGGELDPRWAPVPPSCFSRVDSPERGDWLDEHCERGQTFTSFTRMAMRQAPHGHVRVIELVPVGPFDSLERSPDLETLRRYTSTFFGLEARIGDPLPLSAVSEEAREGDDGQLQITAGEVQTALLARRPKRDVLCRVAVTMVDLYTIKDGEAWNFVFGQARLMDGVGVFSFARYDPAGYPLMFDGRASDLILDRSLMSGNGDEQPLTDAQRSLMLYRSCKVLTHETGHIFGIRHCTFHECLMCGCNHLQEFDRRTLALCPVDLRKLAHAIGFDVVERYEQLRVFYEEAGWRENVEWIDRRLSAISSSSSCEAP